ncbi:MAG TPA: hypothetical protein IAC14_16015 [Candidatus Scybalomonas excrementigallinarum]|nr:hypothetical protein [Candidatus Scybalomonas excrementigallinarum]
MNRLLEEVYHENETEEKIQYEYDLCGNRLSKKQWKDKNILEEKSWYNQKNQLIKRQLEKGTVFYTYDKQGNTIQETGEEVDWIYSYNPFGQQIKSKNTNGYFQENFYDGEYLRAGVKKNESSSKFLYYQGELLSEITKKQEERKGNRLILGYGVVASEELGLQNHREEHEHHNFHAKSDRRTIGFYHLDEQNSTVFITGRNQEIQNSYTYDAFGNVRNQKETHHNRILYTGQQYDKESNQYYLRARYYNPTLGRFTQEDVYRGAGLNLYDYCKGNPVIWYDPSGYENCKIDKGNVSNKENGFEDEIIQAKIAQQTAFELAEKYGYNGAPPKRKTVASDGEINTLSGWKKLKDNTDFIRVSPEDIIDKSQEIGHNLRNAGANDQGIKGKYNASHAEKQLSLKTDKPIGISQPMCQDCQNYFRCLAISESKNFVTADTNMVRIFKPDGSVINYKSDDSFSIIKIKNKIK